jgi:hypothetical protein
VAGRVDTLEAGDDDDLARRKIRTHAHVVDALDARLRVGRVGLHRNLPARVAHGLEALGLQRERQETDGDLLAGGRDHVQLAHRRGRLCRRCDLLRQP